MGGAMRVGRLGKAAVTGLQRTRARTREATRTNACAIDGRRGTEEGRSASDRSGGACRGRVSG